MANRRRPGTSAVRAVSPGDGQAGQVARLLAGESLDPANVAYDFSGIHVALVARGAAVQLAVDRAIAEAGPYRRRELVVDMGGDTTWCWLPVSERDATLIDRLLSVEAVPATLIAVGEPGHGLSGWRMSHRQARTALGVARMGGCQVVRYRDVAVLATAAKDEVLVDSLRRLYLEPLEGGRGGGPELAGTLRAYFESGRSLSAAGERVGVTRQAVARRLRAAEGRIGRPMESCACDLELALRLEALSEAA